jgi:hypothetical protein
MGAVELPSRFLFALMKYVRQRRGAIGWQRPSGGQVRLGFAQRTELMIRWGGSICDLARPGISDFLRVRNGNRGTP